MHTGVSRVDRGLPPVSRGPWCLGSGFAPASRHGMTSLFAYSAATGCGAFTGSGWTSVSSHGPGKRPRPTLSREKMW